MNLTTEKKEQWLSHVRNQMASFVEQVVTPISVSSDKTSGKALGTGNYIGINDAVYLLTNHHVITAGEGNHLGHLPGPSDDYIAMSHHIMAMDRPIDLALMRLGGEWDTATKGVATISMFDDSYRPVEGELLFLLGYPATRATRLQTPNAEWHPRNTAFDGPIENRAVPLLTQAYTGNPGYLLDFDANFHSLIEFPARAQPNPGDAVEDLPNPMGMSGSLLWDTKAVASAQKSIPWEPALAKVCGVIRTAYTKPLVAGFTRVEHILPTMLDFIRHERAFIHWLDRGRPLWQETIDWEWVCQEFIRLQD